MIQAILFICLVFGSFFLTERSAFLISNNNNGYKMMQFPSIVREQKSTTKQSIFAKGMTSVGYQSANICRSFPRKLYASSLGDTKEKDEIIKERDDIRNIAIIAHVDHGKTTLVDAMLQQAAVFRENEKVQERIMDSNDQERERGITILAKNTAITYNGIKINIVDTPGHADFGGEVERVLNMVDGVLLVVDSVEGPKPQTRFVLKKALAMGHKVSVVVNKIDRPSARPDYVVDSTFDLFAALDASDEQIDFDIVYASALNGIAGHEPDEMTDNMIPLFEVIEKLPKPKISEGEDLQMLVANIDYDSFKGKLGIGRLRTGKLKKGQKVGIQKPGEELRRGQINELFVFNNFGKVAVEEATTGDIVMFSGIEGFTIGDTIVDPSSPRPLEPIIVEEPTVKMTFGVNKSPMAGKEGKQLTSRVIRSRLDKELEKNVALRVDDTDSADTFSVSGRGQMHLTVLIENMRREGFELMIGPPEVIEKTINGQRCEPFEMVEVTVPDEYTGAVVDLLARRKGEMSTMSPSGEGQTCIEYITPTRGMIGLRSAMLTSTRGMAVMESTFHEYRPHVGEISPRDKGSLLAYENGDATTFGIENAQNRGEMFINPKTPVYKDMIIGVHQRPGDLKVNVCKTKALNNMRSAGKDNTVGIVPPLELTLDSAVEYIGADELVEVTPASIRMCKKEGWGKK